MGDHQQDPQYSGLDKYPGWLATVITLVIGVIFIGALYVSATGHHDSHQDGHSEDEQH